MTRNIFDSPFAALDIIIAVVLLRFGHPATLNTWATAGDEPLAPEVIAARNADTFMQVYDDRKIAAIKDVRTVTNLNLRAAKEAVEQVYATYADADYYGRKAMSALVDKDYSLAAFFAAQARDAW